MPCVQFAVIKSNSCSTTPHSEANNNLSQRESYFRFPARHPQIPSQLFHSKSYILCQFILHLLKGRIVKSTLPFQIPWFAYHIQQNRKKGEVYNCWYLRCLIKLWFWTYFLTEISYFQNIFQCLCIIAIIKLLIAFE